VDGLCSDTGTSNFFPEKAFSCFDELNHKKKRTAKSVEFFFRVAVEKFNDQEFEDQSLRFRNSTVTSEQLSVVCSTNKLFWFLINCCNVHLAHYC